MSIILCSFKPRILENVFAIFISLFAVAKPFAIDEEIFLRLDDLLANAITDGPAPLMVTPRAPALRAFFFTLLNPGIICCLAGSTITSIIDFPIRIESFFINPTTIAAAFAKLRMLSEILILDGITLLDTLVFFAGTASLGIATHNTRSLGGSILITSRGFFLTITNPPRTDAATLS